MSHTPNLSEPNINGLTIPEWQAAVNLAGQACEANGGSKTRPCNECLAAGEKLIRASKALSPKKVAPVEELICRMGQVGGELYDR